MLSVRVGQGRTSNRPCFGWFMPAVTDQQRHREFTLDKAMDVMRIEVERIAGGGASPTRSGSRTTPTR